MGVVIFAVAAFYLGPLGDPPEEIEVANPASSMFPMLLGVQGTLAVAAAFLLRGHLARRVKGRRGEALEEVAAGIMPPELLMALWLPTRSSAENWLEALA